MSIEPLPDEIIAMIFEYAGDESLYTLKFTCKWMRCFCAKKMKLREYLILLTNRKHYNVLNWIINKGCMCDIFLSKEIFFTAVSDANISSMELIYKIHGDKIKYIGSASAVETAIRFRKLDSLVWLVGHDFDVRVGDLGLAEKFKFYEITEWILQQCFGDESKKITKKKPTRPLLSTLKNK
jgi:hypothetical protein